MHLLQRLTAPALVAASIIVLLAILLTLNAFAIYIRNRYRRTW